MSDLSKIEWTDATWNCCLGCSKVSPGCTRCYAINEVHRMSHNPNPKVAAANKGLTILQGGHPNWTGKVRLIPERLEIPLRTRKPKRYFVNSLSDLFHEDLETDEIHQVWASMALAYWHTFQILTKRAERLPELLRECEPDDRNGMYSRVLAHASKLRSRYPKLPSVGISNPTVFPLHNVWLGVSVESRDYLSRIDHLRRTPAAVRFLSLEPLLEDLGKLDLNGISWVIVGGESGPGARPMHPEWARSIRDQCVASGVPFFFKQHGEFVSVSEVAGAGAHHYFPNGATVRRVGKKAAGRLLDGRTWDEMPEVRR